MFLFILIIIDSWHATHLQYSLATLEKNIRFDWFMKDNAVDEDDDDDEVVQGNKIRKKGN